jgi:hypothetical protein
MTGPAEKPNAAEKHSGGLAQLVRWLNEERPVTGPDDVGFVGAPRRAARWTYGDPPVVAPRVEPERETLGEVRIGPAPRCAVAGETIALSVSLINTRGGTYLGWPIKLQWSSSDPSVATVSDGGIVEIHAKGRVEITCHCEGKSGSVLLMVVEPAVAAMVGLPVPARLLAASRQAAAGSPVRAAFPAPQPAVDAAGERAETRADRVVTPTTEPSVIADAPARPDQPETGVAFSADVPSPTPFSGTHAPSAVHPEPRSQRLGQSLPRRNGTHVEREVRRRVEREPAAAMVPELAAAASDLGIPLEVLRELPAVHRRSVERGSVRHGLLATLAPSRGTRRLLFRVSVGAATGGFIAVALTQSPEEYFVVAGDPSVETTARVAAAPKPAVSRPSALRAALGLAPSTAKNGHGNAVPLADTSKGTALVQSGGRVIEEAAGSTNLASTTATGAAAATQASTPGADAAQGTSVAPSRAASVSRVVVASSPSQLMEGESVRLAAAGVDDRGEAVAGRAVTWTSEDTDVATVDENGVVTAKRAGTVTIVAISEGRAGRVTLAVGSRKAPPPTEAATASAAPARENAPAAAAQVMRARVDEFVQALRERNSERVAALFSAETPQDRKNLQALLERLRRAEARFKASDAQVGASDVREMEATAEFQVPMSWTTPFGRVRSHTATFRAVLEPGDGGWRLVAIRAVGKLD